MKIYKYTQKLEEALGWTDTDFRIGDKTKEILNGKVLYILSDSGICWSYFPIGKNRKIYKDLLESNVVIPPDTKVVIDFKKGDSSVAEYIVDAFGHAILYILNPKASNECSDAAKIAKKYTLS